MSESARDDVARARALSLLRIARLETSWAALRRGDSAPPLISSMHRDLEALRASNGEGVGGVCDAIARVLTFAKTRAYQVPDELAELVTTGIRLSGVTVRGGAGSGRALDGFQRQVHEALREAGAGDAQGSAGGLLDVVRVREPGVRPPSSWWGELAIAATAAFLAQLEAEGAQRARLYAAWEALAGEVSSYRPAGARALDVLRFRATSLPVDVAVASTWAADVTPPLASAGAPVDLLGACFGAPVPDTDGREPPFVLVLRQGGAALHVVAGTLASSAVARPLCPTPETHPVEIVSIDGEEVVLVRPERLNLRSG